jgi:hypothetical protein
MTANLAAIAATVTVAVASCAQAHDTHYSVIITDSVRPENRRAIVDAASEWESMAPGVSFRFRLGTSSNIDDGDAIVVHEVDDYPGVDAYSTRTHVANVFVTMSGFRSEIVAHEFGHAMGLGHQECGVMNAWSGAATHVECCDVEQFCRVWGRACPSCVR